jgi:hypothetical protein
MEMPNLDWLARGMNAVDRGLGSAHGAAKAFMGRNSDALANGLLVGGVGMPLGGAIGAIHPGEDAEGHQRTRLQGLEHGLGSGVGAGLGAAGGTMLGDAMVRGFKGACARFGVK